VLAQHELHAVTAIAPRSRQSGEQISLAVDFDQRLIREPEGYALRGRVRDRRVLTLHRAVLDDANGVAWRTGCARGHAVGREVIRRGWRHPHDGMSAREKPRQCDAGEEGLND